MIFHNKYAILMGLTLSVFATEGCSNGSPNIRKIDGRIGNAGDTELAYNPEEYTCPYDSNVSPDWDWMLNGAGFFEVCTKNNDAAEIAIHGQTYFSNEICVIPAEINDHTGQIFLKLDGSSNGPLLNECVTATETGALVGFKNTNFNAVFIVERPFLAQMMGCLNTPNGPNYTLCPSHSEQNYYSYGRFR